MKYNLRTPNWEKITPPADFTHPNSCRLPPHVSDECFTDQKNVKKSDIDISDDEDEIEAEVLDDFIEVVPQSLHVLLVLRYVPRMSYKCIDTFGEYFPSVVTRDSPRWIPGTAPMI